MLRALHQNMGISSCAKIHKSSSQTPQIHKQYYRNQSGTVAVEASSRSNQPTEILMAAEKAMKKSLSSSNYKGSVILSNTNATRITWSKPDIASVVPAKRRSVKRMIFDDMVKSVSSLVFYCCSSSSSSSADPEDELSNSYEATCRSKNAKKNSAPYFQTHLS